MKIPAIITAAMIAAAPVAAAQVPDNDPALQQVVGADEQVAPLGERAVIDDGHADLGPVFADGKMQFLVRDDTQDTPVWRHLEDVVFAVGDGAKQTLPETDQFAFTGAKPGAEVWVIPQTEVAGVPWLGWNSQAPSLLERSAHGMGLEFGGHEGPGQFSLFVQPGGFHESQQLWNEQEPGTQSMWVEPNTHTHANWVFTEPGVHLVGVRAKVEDHDGTVHEDEQVVRIAVGVDPAEAADATFGEFRAEGQAGAEQQNNGLKIGLLAGAGVLLIALLALFVVRGRR